MDFILSVSVEPSMSSDVRVWLSLRLWMRAVEPLWLNLFPLTESTLRVLHKKMISSVGYCWTRGLGVMQSFSMASIEEGSVYIL